MSNKAMKTATVLVSGHKTHPMYGKSFLRTSKFLVDDQIGVKIGDIVEFIKVAPISKRKHWRISQVVGRDILAVETEMMKEVAKEAIEEVMPVEEAPDSSPLTANSQVEEKVQTATSEKPKKAVSRKQKAVSKEAAKAD